MRMLVNGFAYAYKYFKEAETELVAHTSVLERKMQHLCNWEGSFAFLSLNVKQDRLA